MSADHFRLISERAHWQRVALWRWATAILMTLTIAASSWGGWASIQAARTADRLGLCVEALEAATQALFHALPEPGQCVSADE